MPAIVYALTAACPSLVAATPPDACRAVWSQLVAPTVFERVTDLLITANLLFQARPAPAACCLLVPVWREQRAHRAPQTMPLLCLHLPSPVTALPFSPPLHPCAALQCCLVYGVAPSVIHAYQVYRAEEDMWW